MRVKLLLLFLFTIFLVPEQFLISQQIKFAVVGDFGDGSTEEGAVANMINSWDVDFIVTVGDNYYGAEDQNYANSLLAIDEGVGQFYYQWIGNYQGTYGSGPTTNKFFPVPGNHDWYHLDGLDVYTDYFTLPGTGFLNSSGNERYYDFVWGNIHFFMLDNYGVGLNQYTFPRHGNSGEPDMVGENSSQAGWFFTQIDNCVNIHSHWRVVIAHIPPYSSCSKHGSDPGVQWQYKQAGAHVIISGHDHTYERLVIGGLTYIVNGLGGKSRYFFNPTPIPDSKARFRDDYGAQLVTVIGTEMKFEFWSIGRDFNNVFQLIETWAITNNPPLPVELVSFTVNVNGDAIVLNWETATEVKNYGFEIERSIEETDYWRMIGFVEGHGNSNSPKHYNFSDRDIGQSGKYYYRLKQINNDGTFEYSDVVTVTFGVPVLFALSQNYPNPFNPTTKIYYSTPKEAFININLYDVLGNKIANLVHSVKPKGRHEVIFDANIVSSGIYYYRMQADNYVDIKKMIILK